MRISSVRTFKFDDHQRVEADIDDFALWFRFSGDFLIDERDATPFVVAALVPAMLLGEPLEVASGLWISTQLLDQLHKIQEIYSCWNPIFKIIEVKSATRPSVRGEDRVASFFSGGVDGTYTLMQHRDSIDDLILINGFDFTMDASTWSNMVSRNAKLAESMHKTLIPVETNFKSFTSRFGIARYVNFGSVLAAIGILLGYQRVLFSSSDTYRVLRSLGSHPLLDPLWSTEVTKIHHIGLEADRADKLAAIGVSESALENLWVCWKDPRENCGACSKCLRTAVAMELVGLSAPIFSSPPTIESFRNIRINSIGDLQFYEQFLELSIINGSFLTSILERAVFSFKFRVFVKEAMARFMPTVIGSSLAKHRPEADRLVDISVYPRYSDSYVLSVVKSRIAQSITDDPNPPVGSVFTIEGAASPPP